MANQTTPTLPPLPRIGPIGYARVVDIDSYQKTLTIGTHLPGVRDCALWTTDQMRAYANAAVALNAAAQSPSQPLVEVQEPVGLPPLPMGWLTQMTPDPEGTPAELFFKEDMIGCAKLAVARVAAPVRVLPLTFGGIARATSNYAHVRSDYVIGIARAVEAAHGIGSTAPGGDG